LINCVGRSSGLARKPRLQLSSLFLQRSVDLLESIVSSGGDGCIVVVVRDPEAYVCASERCRRMPFFIFRRGGHSVFEIDFSSEWRERVNRIGAICIVPCIDSYRNRSIE
jgi:hypothetical protein